VKMMMMSSWGREELEESVCSLTFWGKSNEAWSVLRYCCCSCWEWKWEWKGKVRREREKVEGNGLLPGLLFQEVVKWIKVNGLVNVSCDLYSMCGFHVTPLFHNICSTMCGVYYS
jgi:hypothetical protein